MADLLLPVSTQAKSEEVERIVRELGLSQTNNVGIWDIMHEPSLVFLD
jgi:hypothetical protein